MIVKELVIIVILVESVSIRKMPLLGLLRVDPQIDVSVLPNA